MKATNPKLDQMNRLRQPVNIYNVLDASHYGGDVDAVIERHGVWMLVDTKKAGKLPEPQQERHYRELCDAMNNDGKPCVYVVTWHRQEDCNECVELADTQVIQYYDKDGMHFDSTLMLKQFAVLWFTKNGVNV